MTELCFSQAPLIHLNKDTSNLGSYLAGLQEGDGSIHIPTSIRNSRGKLQYPRIKISFASHDLPLALELIKIQGGGTVDNPKGKWVNLQIQDRDTLIRFMNLVNGKLRTPKLVTFNKLIDFQSLDLHQYDLDHSPLNSNSWLAGFIDADGNFSAAFIFNKEGFASKIKTYARISQSQLDQVTFLSKLPIMQAIADLLHVTNVGSSTRVRRGSTFNEYIIKIVSHTSCDKLISYLNSYPLFSAKYLDYLDWVKIREAQAQSKPSNLRTSIIVGARDSMNSKRTVFTWDHLKNLPRK